MQGVTLANLKFDMEDGLILMREELQARCPHEYTSYQIVDSVHDRIVGIEFCEKCRKEKI